CPSASVSSAMSVLRAPIVFQHGPHGRAAPGRSSLPKHGFAARPAWRMTTEFRRPADNARRVSPHISPVRHPPIVAADRHLHRKVTIMKLDFIAPEKLAISKANMRYAKKPPDVSDILPTIRARG